MLYEVITAPLPEPGPADVIAHDSRGEGVEGDGGEPPDQDRRCRTEAVHDVFKSYNFV